MSANLFSIHQKRLGLGKLRENSDTCDGGPHITRDTAIDCETKINVP